MKEENSETGGAPLRKRYLYFFGCMSFCLSFFFLYLPVILTSGDPYSSREPIYSLAFLAFCLGFLLVGAVASESAKRKGRGVLSRFASAILMNMVCLLLSVLIVVVVLVIDASVFGWLRHADE